MVDEGGVREGCSVRPSACEVRGCVRKEKREAMTFHVMPDRLEIKPESWLGKMEYGLLYPALSKALGLKT